MSARAPHLLIVNHFALAPDMGGGTRHVELGRELVRRGWRVTIAGSDFHVLERTYVRRQGPDDKRVIDETVDGVRMRWLWSSPYARNDGKRIANWLSFARSVVRSRWSEESPDVILGSSPQLFAALAAWRVARRLGVPFVLEIRDLWPESLGVAGRRRGPGYWGLWLLARFLYRRATRIVVLSRGVQQYLQRLGVEPTRIVYVPNGADLAAFTARPAPAGDVLRLVYAGAHGPANGLDVVLEAAALMRDEPRVRFLLVGDGPAKQALVAEARARALTNVEFLDPIPKARIPDLLGSCDAGLMVLKDLPLFAFGVSPNKLFDYWGAGLPVICNVSGEVAGWVREANGGVQAADGTAEALTDAIRSVTSMSAERRAELGASGRDWVRREHDRPVLAARLDAAVRPLAAIEAA
ncbi:MAG: glycosyltransferase family 4 protein [Gemmatimonadaceae bacterium]